MGLKSPVVCRTCLRERAQDQQTRASSSMGGAQKHRALCRSPVMEARRNTAQSRSAMTASQTTKQQNATAVRILLERRRRRRCGLLQCTKRGRTCATVRSQSSCTAALARNVYRRARFVPKNAAGGAVLLQMLTLRRVKLLILNCPYRRKRVDLNAFVERQPQAARSTPIPLREIRNGSVH